MSYLERTPRSAAHDLFNAYFESDLALAESAPLRTCAIQTIANNLNQCNAQALARGVDVVAQGYVVTEEHGRYNGTMTEMCGILSGFETIDIRNKTYLCAALIDFNDPEQTLSFILSQDPMLRWSITPLDATVVSPQAYKAWNRIAGSSFDAQDLLSRAASRYEHPAFGSSVHESLQSLEAVLDDTFKIRMGDSLKIEGSQALIAPQHGLISDHTPLPLSEAAFTGTFEGLVTHEQAHKGDTLSRLCVALTIDTGSIVLQPCATMRLVDVSRNVI